MKVVNEMSGKEFARLVNWLKKEGYELEKIQEAIEYITNCKT